MEQSRQGRGVTILHLVLQGKANSSGLPACGTLIWQQKWPQFHSPNSKKALCVVKEGLWASWLSKGCSTVQGTAKSPKTHAVAEAFCCSLSAP